MQAPVPAPPLLCALRILVLWPLLLLPLCCALNNGLALTPAMGFNTWNAFGVNSASSQPQRPVPALLSTRPHLLLPVAL